ncbi:ABC transporter ATP-binding protein [Asticcacaulis sp.]|uniref:ABC transporter ATP-binding protein n=1 Tax=Asticcacaulis sp. TaxID=1872648 RepID=UPI003F7C4A29
MPEIRPLSTFQIITRLAQKMIQPKAGMRWQVALGIVLELAGVALGILGPYFLKRLVDAFANDIAIGSILVLVGLFVVAWSGASILSTVRSVYSTHVIDQMTEDMATSAMRTYLPDSAKSKTSDSGAMLGQLERLPNSLSIVVDGLIWRTIPIVLQLAGSLWLVCALIPFHFALILAITLVGYVLTTWLTAKAHKRRSTDAHQAISAVSRETGDVLRNARRVVFNGALDMEIDNLRALFRNKTKADVGMMWSLVAMVSWQYGVVGAGLIVLLSLGTIDVLAHRMTVGDFILLQAYALRLAAPLSGIGFILSQSGVAIANIREVLAMTAKSEACGEIEPVRQGAARISLKDVSFSYVPNQAVLQNVTLDIEPGTFTVIVGPNGSGKSTLVQIMAGILAPDRGLVKIGGQAINLVPLSQRHRSVLYIPQVAGMFNRPLLANGLYPPTTFTEADFSSLLKKWRFHEDNRELKLDVCVGEQGERLSGGQLQKLELARVAGIHSPAIIFDESTSALDPTSETTIINDLRARYGRETTLVVICHRIELAGLADKVVFLSGGRLLAHGRHQDLLAASTEYRCLWTARDEP